MAHALLSPSSAHRWMHCIGSVNLEKRCPDTSSSFAEEGTAAHELAAECLLGNIQKASSKVGTSYIVNDNEYIVTPEMAEYVQEYLDYVRSLGGTLLTEQRLGISAITGEEDAGGTSDAVVLHPDELIIVDLKYGMGLKVDADRNEQLSIYAAAAVAEYEMFYDFKTVRLVIVQPRLQHISEYVMTVEELAEFVERVKVMASECLQYADMPLDEIPISLFAPGEKPCRFCKAKAQCDAAAQLVLSTVADDFVDETQPILPQIEHTMTQTTDNAMLANRLSSVEFIEKWCEAIRKKASAELHAGNSLPGYKLVEGRRGARQWVDAEQAETMLKSMGLKLDEMYDKKVISPTTAEKLHKSGTIGPRQWPKVLAQIEQKDGKPVVVTEADKRPAIAVDVAADFENLETTED